MATWPELQTYVRQHYRVDRESSDELMGLTFQTTPGRDQRVYISYIASTGGREWVRFASIVGPLEQIDMARALRLGSDKIASGFELIGALIAVVHYQLLATVDGPEIDLGLTLTAANADDLEAVLLSTDQN